MKILKINKYKASNVGGVFFVSLILVLSVIAFASPTLGNPLPPKTVTGTVSRCDGGSIAGVSGSISSSVGTKTLSWASNQWFVDVGPDTGTEWPDGTGFTVSVSLSGWSGSKTGTVSGSVTNIGDISMDPSTALSADAGGPYFGLVGDSISFSGSASGGASPYTYSWDFGDSGSGSGQNPSHTYTSQGSFTATLTVTDACGTIDTDTASVTVNPALSAEAGGPYSGDICDPVSFSGSGIGGIPPYTISWDFGDSGSGSGANPTHQYTSDGGYTATITVTDSDSPPSIATDTASVSISTGTLVAEAGGPYSGDACSPVSFSGSASGGCTPYTYSWTFGDSGSGSGQNPTHQYSDGTYTATITVTSGDGQSDTDTASVTISTSSLTCSAGGPYSGIKNAPISFSASASGGCTPYTYSWTFSDGGSGSGQSVSHAFSTLGSFTATVDVISSDGQTCSDTASVSIVENPPEANANGPYYASIGEDIDFFGSVTGGQDPYSWNWDFGDGDTATGKTPTKSYSEAGTYIVTLTVSDGIGQSDDDITNAIIVGEGDNPIADANGDYEGEVGEEIEFEGDVYGGAPPYTWYWEFGEGNTSDERDPVFIYEEVGEYLVNLTVTDDNGNWDIDEIICTIVPANDPPLKPDTPSGEAEGKFDTEYTYTTSTTDPEGDAIFYKWDFGDGTTSDWLGPFGNGATADVSHTYERPDGSKGEAYEIKVKARDPSGEESPWSDPLPITMPHAKIFSLPVFLEMLLELFPFLGRIFFALFIYV